MIKKIISRILILNLISSIFILGFDNTPINTYLKTFATNLNYSQKDKNNMFTISNSDHNGYGSISISNIKTDKITSYIQIPEYVTMLDENKTYKITEIESNVFQGNTVIETIRIPSSISIDANAFKNCTNLKTVEFYEDEVIDGTISIGANAFDGYIHSIVDISDHNI